MGVNRIRVWGLSFVVLVSSVSGPKLLGVDEVIPLTAEQRLELDRQIAAKNRDVVRAEAAEEFIQARQLYKDLLELVTRRYGAADWRVTDARLAMQSVQRVEQLTAEERAQLLEAAQLNQQVFQLWQARKSKEALPLAQKAVDLRRQLLGEEHPDYALSLFNLGAQHLALRSLALARSVTEKALAIQQKVLGEDHPSTAQSYNNLATIIEDEGRYARAEPLYRRALGIFQKTVGEEHSSTATCYNNLAVNLNAQGKYTDAEPLYRRAMLLRQKVLGDQHPETAQGYNNLAYNLGEQGRHAEAEPLYRRALAIFQKELGEEHPETALCYNNLACNLDARGQHAAAEPLARRALLIRQKVLGENHADTALIYNNVAANLIAQGRYAAAAPFFRRALVIRQKVLGEEHPDTAKSYDNLAANLNLQNQFAAAEPHFRRALAIRQKVLGDNHPDTAISYEHVAANLFEEGQFTASEPLARRALALKQKLLGEGHPDTALSYYNVATNLNNQGHYAEAEPLYRRALSIRRKVLGEKHPETARSYTGLALNLYHQGQFGPALDLARAATIYFQTIRRQVSFSGLDRSTFTADCSPLSLLAILLARAGEPAAAQHALEDNLARGLLDEFDAQRRPLSPAERRRFDELRGAIDQDDRQLAALTRLTVPTRELQQRIDALRLGQQQRTSELTQLQDELRREYGPAAGQVYDLPSIQQHLPADVALLAWIDVARRPNAKNRQGDHWACLIRATGAPVWVRLTGSGPQGDWTKEDTELPAQLRQQLQKRSAGEEWREWARRLAVQRLGPLEVHLRGDDRHPVKHLIVLPSVWMAGIPVETLTDRYSISYAPSGTMLAYLRQSQLTSLAGSMLALGDPLFPAPATFARPALPVQGVVLARVDPDTNASRAGMLAGDVLLRYAATSLAKGDDLHKAIAEQESDPDITRVQVELWRDGRLLTVQVRPGELGVTLSPQGPAVALRSRGDIEVAVRPGERSDSFTPLPGTRREVVAISRLFPQSKLLLGSEASEQQLDSLSQEKHLQQYRYLHLATHGFADSESGLRSYLVLAQDQLPNPLTVPPPGQKLFDGRLSAADIVRSWTLEADLVTLSACETGLGQHQGGEGYLGFAQALFLAGARSLVLSQWKVDDDATALLMVRFYQNLLGQRPGLEAPLGKAAALGEAKTWLCRLDAAEVRQLKGDLRQGSRGSEETRPAEGVEPVTGDRPYQHPYYWAGFILVGDPGDLAAARPVLAEVPTVAAASFVDNIRWWPWLIGCGVVGSGLAGGLVWRRCRRK